LLIASFPVVLVLACAGGWISLSYEIFFFRVVSYATGSSPAAFAATLGAFLIGLASGSREGGEFCLSADRNLLIRRVVVRLLVAGGVGVLFLPLLTHLAWLGQAILGLALIMVYVLARCWGILLPCLAHFGVVPDARAGMRTGLLYLANITGSALGSIFTGFILMQQFGVVALAQLLVAAAIAYAVLFMVATGSSRRAASLQVVAGAMLAVAAVMSIPVSAENVLEALLHKGSREADTRFAHVVENRSGIITVDHSGTVFGNGVYDGHFSVDLVHDNNGIVRPFALSLFHSAPRDVLMIGFSSGSWAQVIANNPAVESLTIVEINPGYSGLVEQAPQTASVLRNPKVKLVADDGRRWLRLNATRHFDLIVANTTYHFREHATNLLSAEFLDLVKNRLKPGGIFFYNTTGSDRVQRTGCLRFPFGARFTNHMVLSLAPLTWDFARWRTSLEGYRIDNRPVFDLTAAQDRNALNQLMSLQASFNPGTTSGRDTPIESCSEILRRTAHLAPVTDDNMGTEWRYFWGWE
jgi:predicted membrane-bound spermidine synthase